MTYTDQRLKIYNSLSNEKELFVPIEEGYVGMYVCGPTVYSNVHLGNVRTFMSFDMIYRYLLHLGYKVRYVRNITDVGHLVDDLDEGEDKISTGHVPNAQANQDCLTLPQQWCSRTQFVLGQSADWILPL